MKKIVFLLLTFLSINLFAQSDTFKVKEGSFHHVQGCVTIPARYDINDLPMAVIKIIPENINEQDRTKLFFEGNLAMDIEVEQKVGETWVYVTAKAVTFLRIKHPDFGVTEYNVPLEIEPNQCYEMVLQNTAKGQNNNFIAINSDPSGAEIYLDGKHYGQTPNMITEIEIGEYVLRLEKEGYNTLTKNIVFGNENLRLNETLEILQKQQEHQQSHAQQHDIEGDEDQYYVYTVNGYEFIDLGLPSGVKWATCNVGAESPNDYGNYYAWGEIKTKSNYSSGSVTYGKKIGDISGRTRYDAAASSMGAPWRMPTKNDFDELKECCVWEWASMGGKKGFKVTGPNDEYIFLPAAGYKRGSSLGSANQYGYYWCSEPHGEYGDNAYDLYFNSNSVKLHWNNRNYGLTIRPVL